MAEELSIDVPEESELSIDVPELEAKPERKRISQPFKQGAAGVLDLITELPGLPGLIGAGSQAGYNYLTDDSGKSFGQQFAEASESGVDSWLLEQAHKGRQLSNKLLGVGEPTSTEDIAARNLALFLPIPAPSKISKLGKLGAGLFNITMPTVKRGTKASMAARGGIQGSIGLGIDQGVRALIDRPKELPLLFSDIALSGGVVPEEPPAEGELVPRVLEGKREQMPLPLAQASLMAGTDAGDDFLPSGAPRYPQVGTFGSSEDAELSIDIPEELSIEMPEELSIDIPEQAKGEMIHDELDTDARMEKANDWEDVKSIAIVLGSLAGGAYLARRYVKPWKALPKPDPKFNSMNYAHESVMDRGKVVDNTYKEMGVDDITREASDASIHTDVNGVARESVTAGKHGQGFDNNKWKSWSANVLDTDEAALRQSGKDGLFNEAMKAQSELAAIKEKRAPSLWRKNITDKQLRKTVDDARADDDIAALMNKHADNYRADLEYEVHRGFTSIEEKNEILRVFGDITEPGEVGSYMPFYNKTESNIMRDISRKVFGINTRRGDELSTVVEYKARGGGLAEEILTPSEAMKRHRLYNTAMVNDQLYQHDILSKMSGFIVKGGKVQRHLLSKGKLIESSKAMEHANTGRGTHLLAVGDDINDPNMIMKIVKDDRAVKMQGLEDMSINDLKALDYGKEVIIVRHKSKAYAYRVPDAGVRAAMNLNPKLGKVLEFNNHWKNIFTKWTTGDYSLFPVISHAFSAQQVASTTAAREGLKEGWKSFGRSLGGSKDIFLDQSAGLVADYLARSIATGTGIGQYATNLQRTLHNRYSNSMLSRVRAETGRTRTGLGSVDESLRVIGGSPIVEDVLRKHGKALSDFYGVREMGLIKNVWKAFNNAANEGPAFGVIQREIGKHVQEGSIPNVQAIRKAVEQGKTNAGDMGRRGANPFVQGIQATIPFSSAMLQSWNALGSAARHDWKAFVIGAGGLIGAPTLAELGMNAALSQAFPDGFRDASGKMWTYDDYYWNGYTTQQRADNMIIFLPGKPPWEAVIIPISPEWGLFRSVVMEGADAIFNLSQTGAIAEADAGKWKVGRDQFLHSLHRVLDLPLPPVLAAAGSKFFGVDIRAGLNIRTGEDPEAPETDVSFLEALPIGTGERITGRMGRTKDVNGFHDKRTAAAIKDLFGAGGTAYVAFADAINAGVTNVGGGLGQGVSQGVESLIDSARRQARYLQPLPLIGGKTFKTNPNDEIAASLHGKRQALNSLSKDMKVLMGGQQSIFVDGKPVDVNTVIPTQDPIRQDLAMVAGIAMSNIAMVDEEIATLRAEVSKLSLDTSLGSQRERQDIIDGKNSEIQARKAQQLGVLHTFEDEWSEELSRKYERKITVNLSGGYGATIAARPNLDLSGQAVPRLPQTSR